MTSYSVRLLCVCMACTAFWGAVNLIAYFQAIVQAMGFDIVIICPGFEDICWVSDTCCIGCQ